MIDGVGLTVVTWNAQGSHDTDIAVAAEALDELAPDVVLLQEIQRRQLGALRVALRAIDGRWRFKHWAVTVPAEGLGVLSRVPVSDVHTQVLAHRWQLWNRRRRIALHVSIRVGAHTVRVIDVHLGAGVTTEARIRQVDALLDRAWCRPGRGRHAGPDSAELVAFEERGWVAAERCATDAGTNGDVPMTLAPTNWRPGPRTSPPTQRLDYVLVQPDALDVIDARVPDDWQRWAELSDHVPVVAHVTVGPR